MTVNRYELAPVSVSLLEKTVNGAESQLIIGDGSVLTAKCHIIGIGAHATHPNPTVLVPNHPELNSLAGVQMALLVGTA